MDNLAKRYYKIKEVSQMLDLPASTLRFWEKKFTIISPRRTGHGARLYTASDIETLRMINFLVKEKGLKLEAAEDEIRSNRSGISKKYTAVKTLQGVRETLEKMLVALDVRQLAQRRIARSKNPEVQMQKVDLTEARVTIDKTAELLAQSREGENTVKDTNSFEPKAEAGGEPTVESDVKPETPKEQPEPSADTHKIRRRRKHNPLDDDLPSLF